MYNDWRICRESNPYIDTYVCNLEDLSTLSKSSLNEAMCRFISEVKKLDGSDFPQKTLYDIVICVQFWLETQGLAWKLFNEDSFTDLRFTLDNLMKERTSAGLGNQVKKADIVEFEDENSLWTNGILGSHNPQVLLNTVVYMLGLHCALRAGKEHRSLRRIPFDSQFDYKTDSAGVTFIRYTEDFGLKTNKGGLKYRKTDWKTVDIHPSSNISRCPVAILSKYFSMLPKTSQCKALYLQVKRKFDDTCWYLDRPVGVITLREVVKNVCKMGSIKGYHTNHSLRASSATRMYWGGVDEQIIQEVTGHRSLCVCSYKRTSDEQRRKVSQIISGDI